MKYKCHICGKSDAKKNKIYEHSLPNLNYGAYEKIEEMIISYRVCSDCGTVTQYPPPDAEILNNYYNTIGTPQENVTSYGEYKKRVYEDRYQLITSNINFKAGSKIIEIGSANGLFLKYFANDEYEVFGVEPSAVASKKAVELGINTICSTLDSEDLVGYHNRFDLALSMHTLEHITDAQKFISIMSALIVPGGYLYIEVPDDYKVPGETMLAWGDEISAVHISHFTSTGLLRLISDAGLTIRFLVSRGDFRYPSWCLLAQKITPKQDGGIAFNMAKAFQEDFYGKAAKRFYGLIKNNKKIAVWGAGSDLWQVLNLLKKTDRVIPEFDLVDRSPLKIGKLFQDVKIISPSELMPNNIIISPASRLLKQQIKDDIMRTHPDADIFALFD